jgi:hypothetical protein
MRFKPRTDLERIFEAINEYSYGRVNKEIIDKQLKALELNYMKKVENENEDEEEDDSYYRRNEQEARDEYKALIEERMRQDAVSNIKIEDPSLQRKITKSDFNKTHGSFGQHYKHHFKRKFVDNSGAKSLMKEYHQKTHFKAATIYTLKSNNLSNSQNENFNKT